MDPYIERFQPFYNLYIRHLFISLRLTVGTFLALILIIFFFGFFKESIEPYFLSIPEDLDFLLYIIKAILGIWKIFSFFFYIYAN